MSSSTMPQFPPGFLEENISYQVTAVAISFLIINVLATIARAVSRNFQGRDWMASDWLIPVSLLFNIGICICLFLGVRWGVGRHIWAVPMDSIIHFTYLTYYGMAPVYVGAVTFSKLAIVDLYLHVFVRKLERSIVYGVAFVLIAGAIANFVTIMAQCTPFASAVLYDPTADGWCHDIHAHFTWASLPNIVTDFILLVLPIPMVLRLQQSKKVKAGILVTFLVGCVGIVTAIVRLVQFYTYGRNTTYADPTWAATIIFAWTCVEPGVYHLAACLITLKPLIRWIVLDSSLSTIASKLGLISSHRSSSNRIPTADTEQGTYHTKLSGTKSISQSSHDDEIPLQESHANGIRVQHDFVVS